MYCLFDNFGSLLRRVIIFFPQNSSNLATQSIGAVNCVVRRPTDGKLIGYNTDYVGAISAIEDGLRGSSHLVAKQSMILLLVTAVLKMGVSIVLWQVNIMVVAQLFHH